MNRERGVHPLRLILYHTTCGTVDPEEGRWLIPHMYSEGIVYHD